jgi:hypothetical protein
MKRLLFVSAVVEAGAGLAFLAAPAGVVGLLLGSELSGPGIPLGRVCGAALLALGVACWLARGDAESRAANGLVMAMSAYNLAAVAILAAAGLLSRPTGIALWPAVALHAGMAVWCLIGLSRTSP